MCDDDGEGADKRKSRSARKSSMSSTKKPRNKSRTRSIFSRKKSVADDDS